MADLTTELVAEQKVLRITQYVAEPTQPLDNSTLLALDIPVRRAAAAANVKKDLNTVYLVALT